MIMGGDMDLGIAEKIEHSKNTVTFFIRNNYEYKIPDIVWHWFAIDCALRASIYVTEEYSLGITSLMNQFRELVVEQVAMTTNKTLEHKDIESKARSILIEEGNRLTKESHALKSCLWAVDDRPATSAKHAYLHMMETLQPKHAGRKWGKDRLAYLCRVYIMCGNRGFSMLHDGTCPILWDGS